MSEKKKRNRKWNTNKCKQEKNLITISETIGLEEQCPVLLNIAG